MLLPTPIQLCVLWEGKELAGWGWGVSNSRGWVLQTIHRETETGAVYYDRKIIWGFWL
jgi:hypothetical protein